MVLLTRLLLSGARATGRGYLPVNDVSHYFLGSLRSNYSLLPVASIFVGISALVSGASLYAFYKPDISLRSHGMSSYDASPKRRWQLFSLQDNPWDQEAAWAESDLKKALDYAGGPIPQKQASKKASHGEHH
jgi:hypothetical protein